MKLENRIEPETQLGRDCSFSRTGQQQALLTSWSVCANRGSRARSEIGGQAGGRKLDLIDERPLVVKLGAPKQTPFVHSQAINSSRLDCLIEMRARLICALE